MRNAPDRAAVISRKVTITMYAKLRLAGQRRKAALPLSAGALLLFMLPTAASAASSAPTTCTGTLPPGTYHSLVVPAGQTCDLGVGPVRVLAGVRVGPGATFMLGFELGPATGTINGGLAADHAAQVQVHNARIAGGVRIRGGSGPLGCAQPFGPVCFTDLEDNSISGGAIIDGYNGFFLGFIRNHVNGSVKITNNTQTMDQLDIGSNMIHGNLTCAGNNPTENTGDSPGPAPDTVTGRNTCHEVT
jgi:hypothetical protein